MPLLLWNSMHMDYLQIEKYRLAFMFFFNMFSHFLPPGPQEMFYPIAVSQSTFINPDKDLTMFSGQSQDN